MKENFKISRDTINKRYCTFHKTNTHNTEQCFTLNKRKNKDVEPKDNNMFIYDTTIKENLLVFDAVINARNIKATVDSGSTKTYMTMKTAKTHCSIHLKLRSCIYNLAMGI